MRRSRWLAVVSSAQLAAGVVGAAVAVRRGRAYHWLFMHGDDSAVAREVLTHGTGLSAPVVPMMLAQLAATALLDRPQRARGARLTLGGLGAAMVPGYLGEQIVRERLHPRGWDPVESPVAIVGVSLAAAMAWLALSAELTRSRRPISQPDRVTS